MKVMIAVEMEHVTKKLRNKTILDDISVILEEGKIYGFVGRNGSGKTMLFRAISGLLVPNSGTVKVFNATVGKDVSFPPEMGIIIENIGFWPNMTGFENLKALALIQKKIDDKEILSVLTRVGLELQAHNKYKSYSLGMKQKLAIAQAIMEKPRLIILDEPMNSLDEESVAAVRHLLKEENARGATILIASHNRDDINSISDEVFLIDAGRLCKKMED
jgi:ABC-2 type transport system ATP-binding protein